MTLELISEQTFNRPRGQLKFLSNEIVGRLIVFRFLFQTVGGLTVLLLFFFIDVSGLIVRLFFIFVKLRTT